MRDLCESLDCPPPVIELVIPDTGRVEPHQVSDFVNRRSVENGRNRGSLDQVAGVQIQARGAVFALVSHGRGKICESASARIVGKKMRVQIV